MDNILNDRIESLPPLPQSVSQLENFRAKRDKTLEELVAIVEKDALISTTLLKVSNSSVFAFRSVVETPQRAVNLLGLNFTLSIALGSILNDVIKADLSPYGVSDSDFMEASSLSMSIIKKWIGISDMELVEELSLSAFLQEIGKFIASDIIKQKGLSENFKAEISNVADVREIERKYIGYYVSDITAQIFKHWKLSPNLIDNIGFVDNLDNAYESCKKKSQILDVVKTLVDMREPLNDKAIELALEKAKGYGFNTSKLEKAIEKIQDAML